MEMAVVFIRSLLLILSFYGYIRYFQERIRLEFCFGLTFCGIGSVLFIAGILNLLQAAAWVLFLGGLILAVLSVKQKKRVTSVLCPGTVFFLLMSVFFLFLLYDSKFVHYDNFSHWARAVRVLIENHRFPSFQDPLIEFTSYPLGSASFIYYLAEISGISTEWSQMYAQAILMLGMSVSLFAFVKGRIPSVLAAVCCILLLCGNNSFFDLLVDNLLALTALSAASFCVYYGRGLKSRIWYLLPYVVFLMNIKSSGLFFVIILYGYVWFLLRQEGVNLRTWLTLLSVPMITLVLWQAHVKLVFANGLLTRHSMSVSNFRNVIAGKSLAEIQSTVQAMAQKVFSPSNRVLWTLLLALLLWLICSRFASQPCSEVKTLFLLAAAAYGLYQIGMLGMYLFSMPGADMGLAEYNRYHQTIVVFVTGLFFLETVQAFSLLRTAGGRKPLLLCAVLAALVVSCFALSPNVSLLRRQQLENTKRAKFDRLVEEYGIRSGGEYLILVQEGDAGYLHFMAQYLLNSPSVWVKTEDNLEGLDLTFIDYVIAFDETEKTAAFLSELSPGYSEPVFCLY